MGPSVYNPGWYRSTCALEDLTYKHSAVEARHKQWSGITSDLHSTQSEYLYLNVKIKTFGIEVILMVLKSLIFTEVTQDYLG